MERARDGRRAALRSAWGVNDDQYLVIAVPPVTRAAGTVIAAWGTLLIQKAVENVRFVLPPGDAEFDRVRRLFRDVGARDSLLMPITSTSLADSAAASDIAIFLPRGPVEVDALCELAAVGTHPLLLTQRAAAFVPADDRVRLCRENDPKDVARGLLWALERLGVRIP
ncbi:MAG: hypothetical protein SF069_17290 [Phycisphaerae bacterium]|nr:hypothetical protein [Phycisphaerae bacterium]